MKNNINWNDNNYWHELHIYDDMFLSFHYDHCAFDEDKYKELIDKWKLNIQVSHDYASVYNDDYNIVFTGNYYHLEGEPVIPGYYLMLSFSKNLTMKTLIEFFSDFQSSLDHFDDQSVLNGLGGHYTCHPKEIIKSMIEKL